MKSDAARNDGIVAPSDEVDQPPIWGLLFVPTQMLDMASTTQQRLHKARPIFLLDLGQRSGVRASGAHCKARVRRPAS